MHFRLVVAASIVALGCGGSQAKDPLATDDPAPVAPSARAKVAANGWVSLGGADAALISEFRTAEYERQWGLGAIRAAEAYALLKKNGLAVGGAGAVVAVSDAGIDFAHPELVGAKHSAGHTAIAGARDGSGYTDAHGTHIAGTIAARRDALGMHGVAFASKLVAFSENRVVDIAAADKAGVHVVNMSWAGGVCNNEHATTATKIATACDAANRDNVQVGAAIAEDDLDLVNDRDMAVFRNVLGAAAAGGVIMVASLAQGAEERHGYPVGFASEPALSGLLVAVGALDNKLAPVSMGCGKSPEAVVERCLLRRECGCCPRRRASSTRAASARWTNANTIRGAVPPTRCLMLSARWQCCAGHGPKRPRACWSRRCSPGPGRCTRPAKRATSPAGCLAADVSIWWEPSIILDELWARHSDLDRNLHAC